MRLYLSMYLTGKEITGYINDLSTFAPVLSLNTDIMHAKQVPCGEHRLLHLYSHSQEEKQSNVVMWVSGVSAEAPL